MTTPTTVQVRLQIRADTAANWTSFSPVLLVNELGLETDTKKFKIGDGNTSWQSLAYFPSIVSGGTVLGNLEIGTTGTLTFEGSTANGFETTLGVVDPTADRTILLPNQSGTVVVGGNASIVDADIAANAEIAVSKLADGAARQLLQTDAAGTGVEWTSNIDIPGTLDVTGAATFDGAVTVAGDLTVNGTTTTISTQNLLVEDKNIVLGDVATPTDVTADGGGITLKGATDKTINWIDSTDAWTSSERFSVPLGSAAAPSLTFTGDPNTGIYSPGADQVAISTGGSGRLFVDSAGKVSVGTDTSLGSTFTSIGGIATAANDATATYEVTRGSTDANPPRIFINKARGTYTSQTLVSSGDGCGEIIFRGHDGTGLRNTAAIVAAVDGTPGSGSMPGRLVLSTTPSGSTAAVERLRITSAGLVGVGTSSPQSLLHLRSDVSGAATQLYLMNRTSGASVESRIAFTTSANDLADNRHAYIGALTTGAGQNGNSFVIATNPDGGSAQTRVFVGSTGNVGIGTTSPAQPLQVAGNVRIGLTTSGTQYSTLSVIGDVAIMQASPLLNFTSADGAARFAYINHGGTGGELFILNQEAGPLRLGTGNLERARIDSSGRLLVGTSSISTNNAIVAVQGRSDSSTAGGKLLIAKGPGDPVDGGSLGSLLFSGNNYSDSATIGANRDGGTWTAGSSQPSRLVFSTTADGASSPTERMRITNGGFLKASDAGTYQGATSFYHELRSSSNGRTAIVSATNASFTDGSLTVNVIKAANSNYQFVDCFSGDFADKEINLRGDGNGLCDGAWTGGGADYAEYFEWSDSNPNAEDRRGISVVLDGDKIREAVADEDPIGVISGNPSVVGDSAWNKWSGKYLRDEFGTYIQEDYEVADDDGNTVIQQRRKLNPAYDPDVEYISREQRPEWDCVGLMGKLRIRKGQVTGSRWIKMRDISATVEEWLVR